MSGTHDHDHDADAHAAIEEQGVDLNFLMLEMAVRELLVEKGVFSAEDVMRQIEDMDSRVPMAGQQLVARFWTEPDFRKQALADGKAAAQAMGIDMSVAPALVVLENTPKVHHVVVCTLCSCYPRAVLGIPPVWYKSKDYRARVVREPRAVLEEFGLNLPSDVEIRVVDSTADMRYLVVPMRPAGTDTLSAEQLADLVTRDSMVGVAQAKAP
ncbi:MAG TPA: nitrile hydratase subunit alpha [bacterium]